MKNIFTSLLLCITSSLSAQIDWNFGTAAGNANPSSGIPANLTVSGITQNNNNGTTALLSNSSVSAGYTGASGNYNAEAASKIGGFSIITSTYFEITLTPAAGYVVAISGFSFGMRSTGTGPQNYSIRSSLDGFASDIATGIALNNSTWVLMQPAINVITSSAGTPVTIRIYGYNGTGSPITNIANWRIDDLKIDAAAGTTSSVINPSSLSATAISSAQINLVTNANASNDNIIVAYNSSNTFGTPVNNTSYSAGASILGGGTVLYNGPAGTFNHTGLNAATTYYYRVWGVNSSNNYSSGITTEATTFNPSASITELAVPQYIGATAGINNTARTPFAVCLQFDNLLANTSYDVKAGLALTSEANDGVTAYGAGNIWSAALSNFNSVTSTILNNAFTTNASGSSGPVWFYFQPTNNTRFNALSVLNLRASYIKSGNTMPTVPVFVGTKNITVLDDQATALTTSTIDDGAFIQGITSSELSGKYVLLYDNESGNGNPLFVYQVMNNVPLQSSQILLPTKIDDIYRQAGTSAVGYFPAIIPIGINNINGVRRIEFRNADFSLFSFFTVTDGNWNGQFYAANTNTISRNAVQTISLLSSNVNNFYTNNNLSTTGNITVSNALTLNTSSQLTLAANSTLTINGIISGTGSLSGSNTSNLYLSGTSGGNAGTIRFLAGNQLLNNFTINRTGSNAQAILGSDLVVNNNLTLSNGIVGTDNNLFTWANTGGTLTQPASYSQSYICTCDINGNEISTTNGSKGFRINNVGAGNNIYFPVGTDFNSANRMMINNNGTADNFTVVVGKGDVDNTPLPRVNRIWYVNENTAGGSLVTMKLYFTKRDPYYYSSTLNDEIETGFDFSDVHLIQKDYNNDFINNSNGNDIKSYLAGFNYGDEVFAQYTRNISNDIYGNTNGINSFSRFSIVNGNGVILPVQIIDFIAKLQSNEVLINWTGVNEKNLLRYEIERSSDGNLFKTFDAVAAKNISNAQYTHLDIYPFTGDNFYRIKAIDRNGDFHYSKVAKIFFGNNDKNISVFPNPVLHKKITVQFSNLPAGNYDLKIINNNGQTIFTKKINCSGNIYSENIDLPQSLAAGAYQVIITNAANKICKTIIVQ
jgi:hypothetical protein